MSGKSKIEWTEQTWNPIVGCSIVSPGCTNCYAMNMASRIEAMGNQPRYAGTTKKVNGNAVWTGKIAQAPESTLLEPLRRKKPTTYFVNSMSDLFHEDVPDEWIDQIFAVMALSPQHTLQVLTKRAARMRDYFTAPHPAPNVKAWQARVCAAIDALFPERTDASRAAKKSVVQGPLPNVWLGGSTERQQEADERVRILLDTPAAIRFVSGEPLLGPIDLGKLCILPQKPGSVRAGIHLNALKGQYFESGVAYTGDWDVNGPSPPVSERRKLDWVIVGGESGPKARPMHPDWARSLRDQCKAAGIPFFFKQWGEWAPYKVEPGGDLGWLVRMGRVRIVHPTGQSDVEVFEATGGRNTIPGSRYMERVGKKAAGRLLDGVEHNGFPSRGSI